MCGIFCYAGSRPVLAVLMEGLRRLEHHGYDSSGLAIVEKGQIRYRRSVGKIQSLKSKVGTMKVKGSVGIAHTRWATHGQPSVKNSHPQFDCRKKICVVHNGIIENHQDLKNELLCRGHKFRSDTDTEVLSHLIEENYKGDLKEALVRALHLIQGTYGIGVISADNPETILVSRRGSPLILGSGDDEVFLASEESAVIGHAKQVVHLQDGDIAVIHPDGYEINSFRPQRTFRPAETTERAREDADKQGFPHFILKEIYEQPRAVRDALRGRILEAEGSSKLGGLEAVREQLKNMNRLLIVSRGTSYHAGILGRYLIENNSDIAVEVDLASEFRHRKLNMEENAVVLAISQSGETVDTLAVIREAKRKGILALGLVNVVGSSIARETNAGVYNHAGPEMGRFSTKSFLSQLVILYLITLLLARLRHQFSVSEGLAFIREAQLIPGKIQRILERASRIEAIAKKYAKYQNFLFIGRKFSFPIALEGALKLKEVARVHSEAYAAGEMKHGPIALIDSNFPSVCIVPRDSVYEKTVSNIEEIKARGGPIIAVGFEQDQKLKRLCDDVIEIPSCDELFTPMLSVVPLQLLAYYMARENGHEVNEEITLSLSY